MSSGTPFYSSNGYGGVMPNDIFDLFSSEPCKPRSTPLPWYPGTKINLEDYGECLLRILPAGSSNAVSDEVLAQGLNLPWDKHEYLLMNLIKCLVLEKGWPIGMVHTERERRFFLIDSDMDAHRYLQGLADRASALQIRQEVVAKGWERRKRSKLTSSNWP